MKRVNVIVFCFAMLISGCEQKTIDVSRLEEILRTYIKAAANQMIKEWRKTMDCNVSVETGIMNCGGSEEFYIEVIDAFIEEGKKEELIKAFEEQDWELYTIDAHSLKGTMRLLGATDAGEMGEKLQFAGEARDIDTIMKCHAEFIEMIDLSIAKIKAEVM